MKARLYFAAVLFLCIRVYESLTQIPQISQDLHAWR